MSGSLSHSPAYVLSELLIDLSLGALSGTWPVYTSVMPDSPDNAISITNTTGKNDGRSMVDGRVFNHYGWQIMVRSLSDESAWTKINNITIALDAVIRRYVPVGSTTYLVQCLNRTSPVLFVGFDDTSKRRLYSSNGYIVLREMAGTGSY